VETIRLHIETQGRNGKTVTILEGFTHRIEYLQKLIRKIKTYCGTGGTLKGNAMEIQGDVRHKIKPILIKEGFVIKDF
jgi:translation initiation factor 1